MTSAAGPTINLVASILAATATAVLAVFAILQWKTMKQNNELVRDRWKREDELRAEEDRPKAAFWLEQLPDQNHPQLWCANIGSVNFIVSGMQVKAVQGEPREIRFSRKNCLIVPVGTMQSIKLIDPEVMFGSDRPGNAEIKLTFQGPTDVKPYHLWFYDGKYMMKDPEGNFQGLLPIKCPKCKARVANFNVSGMTSIDEYKREIADVEKEFEQACPKHASANSRVTFGT
jgi:phage FluMu protein Com